MAKKNRIAVAITPDMGLEVAELNYNTGCIVKYAQKSFDQPVTMRNLIPDMDVFKELLQDCFIQIGVKNAEVVLILPTVSMGVASYMASQSNASIIQSITDDLTDKELVFRDNDPLVAITGLSITTQSKVVAYTASIYQVVQEAATIISALGHKIVAIDNSVAATFRTLIQTGKARAQEGATWLMLLVDGAAARLIALNGDFITEYHEEQIMFDFTDTIGNCDMVVSAMQSYLEKIPAKYLYVVSRTDNVSAEILATKLKFNQDIIFLEANSNRKDAFIDTHEISSEVHKNISPDVIGGCLYDEASIHFNLFTEELGDVYLDQQPLQIGNVVLTTQLIVTWCVLVCALIAGPAIAGYLYFTGENAKIQENITAQETKLKTINAKIEKYAGLVSAETFDEASEIKVGLAHNTDIYTYVDLLGKDMPTKLWLTSFSLGNYIDIEGRADNIESIYTFYRNIKEVVSESPAKLQKLGLASDSANLNFQPEDEKELPENGLDGVPTFDENSNDIILSSNADFYEFIISDKTPKELERLKKPKTSNDKKKKRR